MGQQDRGSPPINVCHVITGLNTGGAETALYKLLQAVGPERLSMQVISLSDAGSMGPRIARLGVAVTTLDMRAGALPLAGLMKLRAHLKQRRPAVVQSWMYHANLLALLASRALLSPIPVVWNVRHCLYDLSHESVNTRWVIRATRMLSGLTAGIIYNSDLSRTQHEALGYASKKSVLIPNGFDLDLHKADLYNRRRAREELCIPEGAIVVGHVGRYHPMKDHQTFLRAATRAARSHPNLHLLMCGRGVDMQNPDLIPLVREIPRSHLHMLGERDDVPVLMSGMDVYCSSSWSEAFPNVLGEAMASEVPCVATDVGDSASIVGDTGTIVPPRDVDALAGALDTMLKLSADERSRLGKRARRRIAASYSIASTSSRYERLYAAIAAGNR